MIKIIHRRTDVAGEKIERIPDLRTCGSFSNGDGQMFFAGRKRSKFRMTDDDAGRNSGIGGDCFVAGIAGDDSSMRTAHYTRQYQCRRAVSIFLRELRQAGGVAIDNGSGRNAMDEIAAAKSLVGK